jgi:hypothetical protein
MRPDLREKAQMGLNRISFLGGIAVGYVLGAQAGRERYEQLKQLARKAAENPSLQQTAGALQAQAQATAKTAADKATSGMRKGASKVTKRGNGSERTPSTASVTGNGEVAGSSGSGESPPFRAG